MKQPKKVGILTFSHTKNMNFGAMLQSYALYTTIQRMGFETSIIDWEIKRRITFSLKDINKDSSVYNYMKAVARRIVGLSFNPLLNFISHQLGEAPFIEFSRKYLPNKSFRVRKKNFSELNRVFDIFVVGSDQVWRYKTCPDIQTFFLDFADDTKNKVAYAASFGIDQWNEAPEWVTKEISHLIKRFNGISVREDHGVAICKNTFAVAATHVLDPTLLLDASEYIELIKDQPSCLAPSQSDFIAVMLLDNFVNDDFNTKLSAITQRTTVNIKGKDFKILGKTFVKYNSIAYWLKMIWSADFVVTDSFHGVVFCLLFEKSFAVIGNKERGLSRLESLLSHLDIRHVLFSSKEDFLNSNSWSSQLNYAKINKKLKEERIKSIHFLMNTLSYE